MTLVLPEKEAFPKLVTDSESLTFSDSCVRSDIADIIKKIYSPRPLLRCDQSMDSTLESRDNVGVNITISRPTEKKEKRFGFYLEPMTRSFAKAIVDSSGTSGSVSVPVVRYKPRRLRRVCECCRRRIGGLPYRDQERDHGRGRVKRGGVRDCSCDSRVEVSHYEIVPTHQVPSLKINQSTSMNLDEKLSLENLQKSSANVMLRRNATQVLLNHSSLLKPEVVPATVNVEENTNHKTKEHPNRKVKKVQESNNMSFLHQVVSKLFGLNKLSNREDKRFTSRKSGNLGNVPKKSSKTSSGLGKESKLLKTYEPQSDLEQVVSSVLPENGLCQQSSNEDSTTDNSLNGLKVSGYNLPMVDGAKLKKETVKSCPELASKKSKCKLGKQSGEKRQDSIVEKQVEIAIDSKEGQSEQVGEKKKEKYDVAYEGLRIERDADWAYEFWGEVFGACHSVVSFFTAFLLHLLTFLLQSLVQPLVFGTVRVGSDHFFQPCLSTAFDSVIHPVCTLVERLALSVRDVCHPVAQCFGVYCQQVSHVCRACRVVEIHKNYHFRAEEI